MDSATQQLAAKRPGYLRPARNGCRIREQQPLNMSMQVNRTKTGAPHPVVLSGYVYFLAPISTVAAKLKALGHILFAAIDLFAYKSTRHYS